MDIVEALKSEGEYLRVDNGDKWLVFDTDIAKWVVYGRKYRAKKTVKLIETANQTLAVTELLKKW